MDLEGPEIELALAVVAKTCCRPGTGLKPVGADHRPARLVADDQVVTHRIEWIDVQPVVVRSCQTLVEFQVEHLEAQCLRCTKFRGSGSESDLVPREPARGSGFGKQRGNPRLHPTVVARTGQHLTRGL